MIQRTIYSKFKLFLKRKEIIALVGPRQVGKTTLLYQTFKELQKEGKKVESLSFDSPQLLSLFEKDTESFIRRYIINNEYLIIDEFQYSKEGGKILKYIYDTYTIKIIISGSSKPELSIESLQYLVGRVLILELFHISFYEFISYKNFDLLQIFKNGIPKPLVFEFEQYFKEFLTFGAYPAVLVEENIELKKNLLQGLVDTYLLKEVKDILEIKHVFEFEKVMKYLSITLGSLSNKTKISNQLDISSYLVEKILYLLEETFILHILRPLSTVKIKELVKSPKLYFQDIGFRNHLISNINEYSIRDDKGFIFEQFVLSEIHKFGLKPQFYNYKNGSEIDFVIEKNGKRIAIEVKSNLLNSNIEKSVIGFIERVEVDKIYILNEKVFDTREINSVPIEITHMLNIYSILVKEFGI